MTNSTDLLTLMDEARLQQEEILKIAYETGFCKRDSGKIIAWGVVPTLNPDDIDRETIESIWDRWMIQANQVVALGIDMQKLINQSLFTPSCGMGSLGLDSAEKVIKLTKAVSRKVRNL